MMRTLSLTISPLEYWWEAEKRNERWARYFVPLFPFIRFASHLCCLEILHWRESFFVNVWIAFWSQEIPFLNTRPPPLLESISSSFTQMMHWDRVWWWREKPDSNWKKERMEEIVEDPYVEYFVPRNEEYFVCYCIKMYWRRKRIESENNIWLSCHFSNNFLRKRSLCATMAIDKGVKVGMVHDKTNSFPFRNWIVRFLVFQHIWPPLQNVCEIHLNSSFVITGIGQGKRGRVAHVWS